MIFLRLGEKEFCAPNIPNMYDLMLRRTVIPAKAGIHNILELLDSEFRRYDGQRE